jgi:carbon monoxide dehydrogenase subunit G
MKKFVWAALAVFGTVAATAAIALPRIKHIERSLEMRAKPEAVFAVLNDPRGFDKINPFRDDDPTLRTSYSGSATGVGSVLKWEGQQGAGSQTIVAVENGRAVRMQLDLGSFGRPRQTFLLTPTAEGTRVTWTLDASFEGYPLGRLFGPAMEGMLGLVYERGLARLRQQLENRT